MRVWAKTIYYLYPTLRIKPLWKDMWEELDHRSYVLGTRFTNIFGSLAYLAHLIYIDSLYKLEPRPKWVALRLTGVAVNLFAYLATYSKGFMGTSFYWVPMALVGIVCTYLQDISYRWYPATPYLFSVLLPLIAAAPLRLSVINTIIYMLTCYLSVLGSWHSRGEEFPNIISFAAVAIMFACALRSRLSTEVEAFLAEQEKLETQKKLIEREMELNRQIKAFLPREIYRRFINLVSHRKPPLEAMEELLRCKKRWVTCLYTDIRGFTKKTKHDDDFVTDSAIPNIQSCTDIVDAQGGIPKLIGDLIFAYFDGSKENDLLKASLAALLLVEENEKQNADRPDEQRVPRFVLLSVGNAVVGNIGGTEGAREINVLGTPANVLSRIDPITKDQNLQKIIGQDVVILTEEAGAMLNRIAPKLSLRKIDITQFGLVVRDFEEIHSVYVLRCDKETQNLLSAQIIAQGVLFHEETQERNVA